MSRRIHADDIVPGTSHDLGEHTVTLEEILSFSADWDPQDFHVEQLEQSVAGHFGGVIASGLHTMAILQRLAVATTFRHWDVLAARRIVDVQFLAPVRAGMTLRGSLTVRSVEPRDRSRSLVAVDLNASADGAAVLAGRHEIYVFRRGHDPARQ